MNTKRRYLAPASARAAFLLACAVLAAGASLLAGCASAPPAAAAPGAAAAPKSADLPPSLAALGDSFGSGGLSDFAARNLGSISAFTLSNGVPVVVKRSQANRVLALSLVIRGGSAAAKPETAGLEGLALATMARGSAGHSYEEIQALLDETSSSIGKAAGLDFSTYSLVTLDKYLDRLLPIWSDTLVRPAFSQKDFDQCLSEAELALQSKKQDPWASTALATNEVFFEGHPYAVAPEGNAESLASFDLSAVKAWYQTAFSANRMFVVAVGDFDPESLRSELEAGIGAIPDRGFALPPPAPAFDYGSGVSTLAKVEFPQSKGVAYLRGDFAAPGPEADDFMALNIGMEMFADLLLNVVRDKYGAVYSPGAYIRDSLANYGSIIMFKTAAAGKIKSYIDEAAADLARGMALSVDPTVSDGAQPRMSVEDALPAYKAKYVNALFQGQSTNAQVASRIAKSVISAGDCRAWLLDFDRIESVTAVDVRAAIAKYVAGGRIDWVLLGSADAILPAFDGDYESWPLD